MDSELCQTKESMIKATNGKYTTRRPYILLKLYLYYQIRNWIVA